jgi:hypothetical protein
MQIKLKNGHQAFETPDAQIFPSKMIPPRHPGGNSATVMRRSNEKARYNPDQFIDRLVSNGRSGGFLAGVCQGPGAANHRW